MLSNHNGEPKGAPPEQVVQTPHDRVQKEKLREQRGGTRTLVGHALQILPHRQPPVHAPKCHPQPLRHRRRRAGRRPRKGSREASRRGSNQGSSKFAGSAISSKRDRRACEVQQQVYRKGDC